MHSGRSLLQRRSARWLPLLLVVLAFGDLRTELILLGRSFHADGVDLCDPRSSTGDPRFAQFGLFMATLSLKVFATKFVPE